MAKRKRKKRRRRRGRFGFLYKLLSIVLIGGAVVAALTLFFRVDSIQVEGNQHYADSKIQEVSGVETNDNLILLNKFDIKNQLLQQLPYIEEVRIRRQLPDTLVIQVKECQTPLGIAQGSNVWLISPSGKIVAKETLNTASEHPWIDGCQLLSPSVGTVIAFDAAFAVQQESLLALLDALQTTGMLTQVNTIHLGDSTMLRLEYASRFTVELPYSANYTQKLENLAAVEEQLESNETGTINLRMNGRANFIPG